VIASGVRVRVLFPRGVAVASLSSQKTFKTKKSSFKSFFSSSLSNNNNNNVDSVVANRTINNNNNNNNNNDNEPFDLDVGNALQSLDIALRLETTFAQVW
jgi:hypothetical protein